jgi:hypothetical protein
MKVWVFVCLSLSTLVGCAGPMTPFGAVGVLPKASDTEDTATLSKQGPRVRFTPDRQVLHTASNFSVIIEDPEGVPNDFKLTVNYNGIDVSRQFLAHAEWTNVDPIGHEVRLTTKFLRLLPTRDNKVKVKYWHSPASQPVVAQYLPPVCSAFTASQMVFSVPDFDAPLAVLQLINQNANRAKLNPYFIAALVAQESGFDPQALSYSKAIGLTQVTSLGESEIIKRGGDWPRYPGLGEMPLPFLKLAILNGRINGGNEWRLDPALSIAGGVEYLNYLSEYWGKREKRAQVEKRLGPSETALSEVILASYNSGASRVSDALEAHGLDYLQDEELGEARKYVRRVVSYCDHFEHREDAR